MEQNGQKNFLDNFKNPNGSYHIPVWLSIVGFMFNWLLGLGLLIAHMSEDDSSKKPKSAKKKKPMSVWKKKSPAVLLSGLGAAAVFIGAVTLPDSIQYLVWCIQDGSGISYGVRDVAQDCIWILSGILLIFAGMLIVPLCELLEKLMKKTY